MSAKRRLLRVLKYAGVLTLAEVSVCNIEWLTWLVFGGKPAVFTVPPAMVVLTAAALLFAAFKEEITARVWRADNRLFPRETRRPQEPQGGARYERLFLWMALGVGVAFVFLIPPMTSPDETNHFTRALLLAGGQFFPALDSDGQAVGKVTADLPTFLSTWNANRSFSGSWVSSQALQSLLVSTASPAADTTTVSYPYPYLSFFLYLPQAAGIVAARALFALLHLSVHCNLYVQLLFARLFNLGCYVALGALALRVMPFFRRTLALLLLMPMPVYIAASCNYDVFLYGACFLYLALVLHLACDPTVETVGRAHLAALAALQFCILVAKYLYFPLLFLILLIPRRKFKRHGRRALFATLAVSGGCMAMWLLAYKISVLHASPDPFRFRYREQAQFVLTHLPRYLFLLWQSLFAQAEIWETGFVGLFGWLNNAFPLVFVQGYIILLLFSALMERVDGKNIPHRRLPALLSVACYVLVASAEYVIWTPSLGYGYVGQNSIIGMQGRYFIPFALPLLLLLANPWPARLELAAKTDRALHKATPFLAAGSLGFSVLFLLQLYWIRL